MFWLGWGKKIKQIFTKKDADKLYVKLNGNETINGDKTFNGTTSLGRVNKLGSSNGETFIIPNKTSGKSSLKLGNSESSDNQRYDIDLQGRSRIMNVPVPTQDSDVASKFYVDRNFIAKSQESSLLTKSEASNLYIPKSQESSIVKTSGDQTINGNKTFNNKVLLATTPTDANQAVNKQYVDNGFVSKTQDDDISGNKDFINTIRFTGDVKFGLVNDPPILRGQDYLYSNGKLTKTGNSPITHNDELVPKRYVDYEISSRLNNINSIIETKVNQLIQPLKDYAKTGILKFQIIDFNTGRVRVSWAQKPLGWVDTNILLKRLHISGQRYGSATNSNVYTEFTTGGYQEFSNFTINPSIEFTTTQLNNGQFKDLNLSSTIYMWLEWNTQYVDRDFDTKIQVPAAFRYEKNGYSWYVPVKIK